MSISKTTLKNFNEVKFFYLLELQEDVGIIQNLKIEKAKLRIRTFSLKVSQINHSFWILETTSSLLGKGKKSFFDTWTYMDDITPLFKKLSSIATPDEIS